MNTAFKLVLKEFLTSKKFIAAVGGLILTLTAKYGFAVDPEVVNGIVYITMLYVAAQGVADIGKEAAKVKGTVDIAINAVTKDKEPPKAVKDKLI